MGFKLPYLEMSIAFTLFLGVLALLKASTSPMKYRHKVKFTASSLQSCKRYRREAPRKPACNSLTYSSVYIYVRVASERPEECVLTLQMCLNVMS